MDLQPLDVPTEQVARAQPEEQQSAITAVMETDSDIPVPAMTTPLPSIDKSYPDIWTMDQWTEKKKSFPWLDCREGKLGCKICESVDLSIHKPQGVSIAAEWKKFSVTYYGNSQQSKLASLRKKINRHKGSTSHTIANKIYNKADEQAIETHVDTINRAFIDKTEKVFRSAYFLAKQDRPYSDHPHLIELQELNGVDLGIGLRIGLRIVYLRLQTRIGLRLRIVYLKCQVLQNGEPHYMFLDLIELADQSAATIFESLLKCLAFYGFDSNYLKNNLIAFASDGASVMLGRNSGVAALLLEKYPKIIIWHCLNHHLELAVSAAIKEVSAVNHFQAFFDKLYSLYSHSPKNHTAECERGFSHMNIIISDTRSKLLISNVSSLLFIKLHGPPLKLWNPTKYAKLWLRNHRSATDTQTRVVASKDVIADPLWQFL
ncbi:E3 SUMO-protein ligase KIAA1586-like [Brachyhypopomus gauderio]|uniref:E3 SUMO-protein ligase KIAA1586-like n=1 Tax=Brachyhypopomus gauderio TaxID=698409 RepID=UPI0040417A7D